MDTTNTHVDDEYVHSYLHALLSPINIDVLEVLDKFELNGHHLLMLKRGRNQQIYSLSDESVLSPKHLWDRAENEPRPLLFQSYISERTAQICEELDVDFVDEEGNCLLKFADVYVKIRHAKSKKPSLSHTSTAPALTNLFSRRRSQVIFALLTWPEIVTWSVRDIAEVSGVSVGQAQSTLKYLQLQGYLDQSRTQLYEQEELFRLWLINYPTTLMPSLRLQEFQGDLKSINPDKVEGFVSGEAAVPEDLNPASLVMYVSNLSPEVIIRNRWRVSAHPNIFLRAKFWKQPSEVRSGLENYANKWAYTAPLTLVYADLLASGDSRQKEIAENLRGRDERLFSLTSG